jgi:hypothetical protein
VLSSSFHLAHCLILLEEPGTPQLFARYGSGPLFQKHLNQPLAQRTGKDVLVLALARGEDVLIENPADPKILAFLPLWLREGAGSLPVILLPIPNSKRNFGVICGISRDRKAFELVARCSGETKQIRAFLSRLNPKTF